MKSANLRSHSGAHKIQAPRDAGDLAGLIEAGRAAFARYENEEAVEYFHAALASDRLSEEQRATLSCLAAEALEGLARYREAIEVLSEYDQTESRAMLHPVVLGKVYLRLGSAYGYTADRPKAISFARNALALAEERDDIAEIGNCHQVLGRIYRAIGETKFARDHFLQALKHHRLTGHKVSLASAYHGLAMVAITEGDFKSARDYHDQALNLLSENDPPLLFGHIYMNSAVMVLLQEQGQEKEGADLLQRAARYFERSGNKRLLAATYTNLGFNLLNLGDTRGAREALETAITLAREVGDRIAEGNSLETLGELAMICGQFEEAERLVRAGIAALQQVSGRFVEIQAQLILGRCHLLQGSHAQAEAAFNDSFKVATDSEDQRGQAAARLWIAETYLEAGDYGNARGIVDEVSGPVERLNNTVLIGHLRELSGRLASAAGNHSEAVNLLSQAVSIFEMVSNRYRAGRAGYHLGNACTRAGEVEKARAELGRAREAFMRLEAAPMLGRTEAALARLDALTQKTGPDSLPQPTLSDQALRGKAHDLAVTSNAALLRLAGAASSRELLLHELTRIIHQDLGVEPVIVYEFNSDSVPVPLSWQGCHEQQAEALSEKVAQLRGSDRTAVARAALYELHPGESAALVLYLGDLSGALHPHRQFIEPLIRLTEMGLELCTLRSHVRTIEGYDLSADKKEIELPGMVYQSIAMRALVDEINKIRGSTVTVLVTGESGTGKEVIARAIHTLSDRREAPFVAFNCTVAPKEIIDSQLFGHRKGAFTGANADYRGVIRSAAGGTLFLDEVGDLALDVQPKLLRFLQEGEIQPLGETSPVKVSVRVIAATNCDLEKLVAEGKFREDLFYRLNVIRLHMPPLRERRDEIPALVTHMITRYSVQENKEDITIAPQALDMMLVYDWPGNVRQLANEIQRLIALTPSGGEITEDKLSPLIRRNIASQGGGGRSSSASYFSSAFPPRPAGISVDSLLSREAIARQPETGNPLPQIVPGQKLADAVSALETRMLRESVARNRGNLRAVARELGLSPRGLYLKLERYQIEVNREQWAS
ncbi:MAG TPA: sigma 54-interacting transcriptional regulator [Blastocatellia bacterium]|nr:sigma 54-interacting transcriptional regulator [Blastocatellia bacterium]